MSNEWIRISQRDINQPSGTEEFNGSRTQFMLSPSDVPTAYRSHWETIDSAHVRFFIEFKYLSESESTKVNKPTNDLEIHTGTKSKRIYKLSIVLNKQEFDAARNGDQYAESQINLSEINRDTHLNPRNQDAIRRFMLTTN